MTTILTRLGYGLVKDNFSKKDIEEWKIKLTFRPKVHKDYEKFATIFRIFKESKTRLYIPRYEGIKHYGKPDINKIKDGENMDFKSLIKLRDYHEILLIMNQ